MLSPPAQTYKPPIKNFLAMVLLQQKCAVGRVHWHERGHKAYVAGKSRSCSRHFNR